MLPQEALKEFKELWKKRYGVELSDKEASLRANNLLNLYRAVYGLETFATPESRKPDKNT